jgi:hypothetical protein
MELVCAAPAIMAEKPRVVVAPLLPPRLNCCVVLIVPEFIFRNPRVFAPEPTAMLCVLPPALRVALRVPPSMIRTPFWFAALPTVAIWSPPPAAKPAVRTLYNDLAAQGWTDIRDFLALHYKLNTALDTPFWRDCREDTDVSNIAGLLEFYADNGPTGFCRYRLPRTENDFGVEGFLVMLVENCVPYGARQMPSAAEPAVWEMHRADFQATAQAGLDVRETLAYIRHPEWTWHADLTADPGVAVAHEGR